MEKLFLSAFQALPDLIPVFFLQVWGFWRMDKRLSFIETKIGDLLK
ncbi:MAG: hypothetical protein KAJ75_04500 [Alphaproteobacteria bacterium]|nr:hypothetical protein [Alphaproteobacteria bacterium]